MNRNSLICIILLLSTLSSNVIFSKEKEILGYKCIYEEHAIFRDNNIINTRIELKNHSPMGLSWGYDGSGSLQTALAVLCDFTKDNEFSLKYYINFKYFYFLTKVQNFF